MFGNEERRDLDGVLEAPTVLVPLQLLLEEEEHEIVVGVLACG